MRSPGLEWLYRLTREPRRLARRYLFDCPMVFPALLRERLVAQCNLEAGLVLVMQPGQPGSPMRRIVGAK